LQKHGNNWGYLIDAQDLDEAISIAGRIPESVKAPSKFDRSWNYQVAIRAVVLLQSRKIFQEKFLSLSISQPSVRLVSKARVSSLSCALKPIDSENQLIGRYP